MASLWQRLEDRWLRISERERRLFSVLGITGLCIIVVSTILIARGGLIRLQEKNAMAVDALARMKEHRNNGVPFSNKTATGATKAVRLASYLEDSAKRAETRSKSPPRSIKIPQTRPLPVVNKGTSTEERLETSLRGIELRQAISLLQEIESGSDNVFVTELELKRGSRNGEKLDLRIVVSTFSPLVNEENQNSDL